MNTNDAAHIRCMIFELTSPVAFDAVGSHRENMWQTEAEVEQGITDAAPFGYDTVWFQVGCDDFEGTAPGWDLDPEEVRAAYRFVAELDEATLDAFDTDEGGRIVATVKERARTAAQAAAATGDEEEADEEPAGDVVQCPKCQGKMGFANYRHVPHKHVGGLCFECDGKGVVLVADAEAFLAKRQAQKDARIARDRARTAERKAQEDAAHDAAFDRYGEEYRLVYALSRYDHRATLGAVIDLNAYRANDATAMRRVRDRLPYMVEAAGLDGLGLEEIEALAADQEAGQQ